MQAGMLRVQPLGGRALARLARWHSVVVYGANTDVGKTLVSCGLLQAAERTRANARYIKPVQTGPDTDEGWIHSHTQSGAATPTATLFAYTEPLSPHLAAKADGVTPPTDEELLGRIHEVLQDRSYSVNLVETAGGVLSPCPSGTPQADVYSKLPELDDESESILVGDPALGGISATLCALESLQLRKAPPRLIVFVGGEDNAEAVRAACTTPVVVVPQPPPMPEPLLEWYRGTQAQFETLLTGLLPRETFDRRHIWHPYTSLAAPAKTWGVRSAEGVRITLDSGASLIDGMSSWWAAIHGYNVLEINKALVTQNQSLSHIMFGGFHHAPAVDLCKILVEITPPGLECVFLADSGSVSIEAALKMAIQYWMGLGKPRKSRMMTIRKGYHGDTLGAMSVCDPVNSMHSLFAGVLPSHIFIESLEKLEEALKEHHEEVAALILEPIVQGAGGMKFYPASQLAEARELCNRYGVLLIADEIATGFGRTGEMFACDHANIVPDIMCVGKALTGGYMTLAAVITTRHVAEAVSGECGTRPFMHGPTYMGNPLACSAAVASLTLLQSRPWREMVSGIEATLARELEPCRAYPHVEDVRVLGAIGVVELKDPPSDPQALQAAFVESGVWVRPFGRLVYLMPPFVIGEDDLMALARAVVSVVAKPW